MLNKCKQFSLGGSLVMALLVAAVACANEEQEPKHVSIGTRALSQEERVLVQEQRAALAGKNKCEEDNEQQKDDKVESRAVYVEYYTTSHEGAYHRALAITPFGDEVELEDGSRWYIRSNDRYKTLDWMVTDTIIILPNSSWFSAYDYKLVNLNTGASVKANISLGPLYSGYYTHWIIAIDYFNQEVILDDGSVWIVSGSDYSTMDRWEVNDTLIIGVNDGWFSSKPNILLNVNTLDYVTAKCIN